MTAFDCSDDILRLERAKGKILGQGIEPGECGVNIKGHRHDDGLCANATWDQESEEEHCKVKHLDYLDLKQDEYKWLTPMFEFYWQNGNDKKGMSFLQAAGFITSYEYVL